MRPQPLICVRDVEASSRWYQRLLMCGSAHGGPHYERLVASGKLVLQLHHWEVEHHHGRIGDPADVPPGNGVLLWFEVDDIDAAIARADDLAAEVLLPRHRNPPDGDGGPNHWELWLRDPDGYKVVLASPDGTADGDATDLEDEWTDEDLAVCDDEVSGISPEDEEASADLDYCEEG